VTAAANSINEFGRYDARVSTKTITPWHDVITYPTKGGTATLIRAIAQLEATFDSDVVAILATESSSVSHTKSEYGLFDYTISRIPREDGGSVAGTPTSKNNLQRHFIEFSRDTGVDRWRKWSYTFNVIYSDSESDAMDDTNGSLGGPHMQARVWKAGAVILWGAINITAITVGAWSTGAIS